MKTQTRQRGRRNSAATKAGVRDLTVAAERSMDVKAGALEHILRIRPLYGETQDAQKDWILVESYSNREYRGDTVRARGDVL